MKKKLFSCILLAVFACVALFSFAACSSDQNVSDRLDALESDMDALETRMEALEAANANFQQQLAALDTSSDTFEDDLAELTSNYNSLTASVQNATHIERVVVNKEDIGSDQIISSIPLIILDINNGRLVVGCSINISTSLFPYQIITCKTDITYNDQIHDVDIFLSKSDIQGTSSVSISGSTFTDILLSDTTNVTSKFDELVLYRFT